MAEQTNASDGGIFGVINNAISTAGNVVSHNYDLQAAKAGARAVVTSPITYVIFGGIALLIVVMMKK